MAGVSEKAMPIVVGIDGSAAAINAAVWAAAEAVARSVPLRLVHVRPVDGGLMGTDGSILEDRRQATEALRAASVSVAAAAPAVKIETEACCGAPGATLVAESHEAAMVCIGSTGIGAVSATVLGSTAADVVAQALCPAAVIRSPHQKPLANHEWIVAAIDGSALDETVIEWAIAEAELRQAPILAVGVWSEDFGATPYDELDRRVQVWRDGHPGLRISAVTTRNSIAGFLAENVEVSVELAVISSRDAHQVGHIIGPHRHPIVSHGYCSVLVAR